MNEISSQPTEASCSPMAPGRHSASSRTRNIGSYPSLIIQGRLNASIHQGHSIAGGADEQDFESADRSIMQSYSARKALSIVSNSR